MHEYASGVTSTAKAELFCRCKHRKFIGQNKVKICKLWSQNFKILGEKIGCPNHYQRFTAIGEDWNKKWLKNWQLVVFENSNFVTTKQ